ncbi:MAG: RecQ family ATP-dependent DNA helicase [Cyanobacteria bacterium M5B4]|nr:MAG: RecQ family ATP-dependent DNA helicase [Cyanobacteria bacterium M5B4]
MFHEIRMTGNQAVHAGLKDITEAERILNIVYSLSEWFVDTFYATTRSQTSQSESNSTLTQPNSINNHSLDDIIYIDLEVDSHGNIYRVGLKDSSVKLDTTDVASIISKLDSEKQLLICGHNFRRFDYPHLQKLYPDLENFLIIDTLELSVIAFPLEYSHKLNKEYKPTDFSKNNPLEDALATAKLLQEIIETLSRKSKYILQILIYLLSCGNDDASKAYKVLFGVQDLSKPDINLLPSNLLSEIDTNFLEDYIEKSSDRDFDERLCLAGILAWKYESKFTHSTLPPSGWLSQLPGFQSLMNNLSPLEFTYQPYLQEFGIKEFRNNQEEAIQSILSHENPIIIMATGGGKSLCYQLPALLLSRKQRGLSVVISPLQALMEDQVKGLLEKGLDFATFINGNLTTSDRSIRLQQVRDGEKDLLYISPEQLRSPSIRALFQQRLPSLIVFDEAHCISQWGHDFRPDYRYAPKFINQLYQTQQRQLPLMAFMTATATKEVRDDIKELLTAYQISIGREIASSSKRENLKYQIIPTSGQDKDRILIEQVKDTLKLGGAILIYTTTRRDTEKLAKLLEQNNIDCAFYHGRISREDKREILQKFKSKELNVIVATCAFGMGIDRPDVRAVIHHTMSSNLETYVQESGRAGRDGKPAECKLLFDQRDSDTVFFLQSLNWLSEKELCIIFLYLRNLRDQVFKQASETYFWVTTNEIFRFSDLDKEFAQDNEQLDTKIKVALHYLETFGMIEREENQSSFVKFDLVYSTPAESLKVFEVYAHKNNLSLYQKHQFKCLILAMHVAKAYCETNEGLYSLEKLADQSGLEVKELKKKIKELQEAGICSSEIPIVIIIDKAKGERGGAIYKLNNLKKKEKEIADALSQTLSVTLQKQVNCKALATYIDPDRKKKISASQILEVIENWHLLGWTDYKMIRNNIIKFTKFEVGDYFDNHYAFVKAILDAVYQPLGEVTGKKIRVNQSINELLEKINQSMYPQICVEEDLEKALMWMYRNKIILIGEGLNLSTQYMKLKVIKNVRVTKIQDEYPKKVQPHYGSQIRRTHIMLDYAEKCYKKEFEPQQYIDDYFNLPKDEFNSVHPEINTPSKLLPVTQEDFDRIMSPLNPIQKEIVLCEAPAICVIAGPGSGKTRTIVHRIAYLIKVKRVDPSKIIALAYNRNAVRELRIRLQKLIGELASRLRVYTFHGLSLAILGRTVEKTKAAGNNRSQVVEEKFEALIKDACQYLTQIDEDQDSEDLQLRVSQLVGNCEYIFVDEYQDVAEYEYNLVKLIAGLQVLEDKSKSVATNICVIGDDDQNIYEFRGTSTEYIRSFQAEYQAKQFLLTENYRSTEPIIAAANRLIQNNTDRLKRRGDEQVRIDNARVGQGGLEVQALNCKKMKTIKLNLLKIELRKGSIMESNLVRLQLLLDGGTC